MPQPMARDRPGVATASRGAPGSCAARPWVGEDVPSTVGASQVAGCGMMVPDSNASAAVPPRKPGHREGTD
jgi:hypothetical protein